MLIFVRLQTYAPALRQVGYFFNHNNFHSQSVLAVMITNVSSTFVHKVN